MKPKCQIPHDPNVYAVGFRKGMDIAIRGEDLNLKKINPYYSLLNPSAKADFNLGAKTGFQDGVRLREQKRARELLYIESKKSRDDRTPER